MTEELRVKTFVDEKTVTTIKKLHLTVTSPGHTVSVKLQIPNPGILCENIEFLGHFVCTVHIGAIGSSNVK